MSVNNEHEMLEPEQELKNVGLKATAPRMRILELFQKAQEAGAVRHLTAEDIYKQLVAENIEVGSLPSIAFLPSLKRRGSSFVTISATTAPATKWTMAHITITLSARAAAA